MGEKNASSPATPATQPTSDQTPDANSPPTAAMSTRSTNGTATEGPPTKTTRQCSAGSTTTTNTATNDAPNVRPTDRATRLAPTGASSCRSAPDHPTSTTKSKTTTSTPIPNTTTPKPLPDSLHSPATASTTCHVRRSNTMPSGDLSERHRPWRHLSWWRWQPAWLESNVCRAVVGPTVHVDVHRPTIFHERC